MDFGFIDESAIVNPEDLIWIDVVNDQYYG
jgi:hypothetical protein